MLTAQLIALFGMLTVAMCWAFAVFLYRVGTASPTARQLALLLFLEGLTLGTSFYIDMLLPPAAFESSWYPTLAMAASLAHLVGDCAMLVLYPAFLASALHTRLTRGFGRKGARQGLAGASMALFLWVTLTEGSDASIIALYVSMTLLFVFALIASIQAWRHAKPGIMRTRAGIFAIAFGFRDLCWGYIYADGIRIVMFGHPESMTLAPIIYALGTFTAIPLIAYGVARSQLFDIDLRIRWTIKQSTLAAIIVTTIFLISEGADRLLSSELGDFAGLLAAALLIFFLTPLQNFAERIASAAMPNTQRTPEYEAFRKMQVYEAAVTEALQEEGISHKERALLVRLRDSLGISEADAEAIEQELTNRQSEPTVESAAPAV